MGRLGLPMMTPEHLISWVAVVPLVMKVALKSIGCSLALSLPQHQVSSKFCVYCVWVWVLVAQSCLTLCDPMNCSPPGSSVHGMLQVRILEQVAIPFSRGSSQHRSPILQVNSLQPKSPGLALKQRELG